MQIIENDKVTINIDNESEYKRFAKYMTLSKCVMKNKEIELGQTVEINPCGTSGYGTGYATTWTKVFVAKIDERSDQIECHFYHQKSKQDIITCWVSSNNENEFKQLRNDEPQENMSLYCK